MKFTLTLASVLLLAPLVALPAAETKPAKPNIVIFIADDFCGYDVACFGGPTGARTPNLDQLAREGMKLTGCYDSSTVCSPTRQALLTGIYPVRNGAYPNHSAIKDGVKTLPTYLKALGYRTACIGKEHFDPLESYPFDQRVIAKSNKAESTSEKNGDGERDDGDINLKAFETFAAKGDAPFCAYLATHEPHGPHNKGDPAAYDPKTFVLPPYMPDTPDTRRKLQGYYAEVAVMDQQVGEVMQILERTGQAANTLMIFVSEQGGGSPFSKFTLYNPGIHAAAIARWPGHIKAGSSSPALTQYEDILPTILAAAGADPAQMDTGCPDANGSRRFDGRSALDVLLGETDHLRDHVFGQNTMLGINGITSPYASRMVCDGRWKLIVNYHASEVFPHFALAKDWKAAGEKGDAFAALQAARYTKRPETELYDLQNDPWELKSVAEKDENKAVVTKLRTQLDAWLKQQGDDPVKTESEAYQRQPRQQKSVKSVSESPAEEIGERKKQFERKDKNRDGKLSPEEFTANPQDAEAAKLRFVQLDTDKNGFLSAEEFTKLGGKSK